MASKMKLSAGSIATIVVVLAAVVFGGILLADNLNITSEGNVIIDPDTGAQCDATITPDVTLIALDGENLGTAITETGIYRKVGTISWSNFTPGTAITNLEIGKTYEYVPGITTSDFTDNAYGEMSTFTVKCKETEPIEFKMFNDEIETSLSATFYNKDNDASAQTFLAGDVYTVSARLKAGKDEFFGNPTLGNEGVVVLKLNKSEWERPLEVRLADGTELRQVSTPLRYDQQESGFVEYAYAMPSIGDVEVQIFFDMEADGTNAPSVDGTAYFYAANYYIDDNAEVQIGVEDQDGNAVGTDSPDSLTLDFTA